MKRSMGRFWLTRSAIDDNLALVAYAGLIPLDVRHDFATDRFDVTAIGDCFAEVERGQEVPRYRLEFLNTDSAGARVGWYRRFTLDRGTY
jgi:hypothetical protein